MLNALDRNAPRFVLTAVHRAGVAALLSVTLAAPEVLAQSAGVAAAEQGKAFSIPAGPLEDALNTYARQAGVTLTVDPALVRGKSTAGVTGRLDGTQALTALLAGTGMVGVSDGAAIVVKPASVAPPPNATDGAALEMPVVRVTAPAATERRAGSFDRRGDPAPVEPGVVPAAAIERYSASDLEDVFASQPEVVVGGGHGIAQKIYVRGLEDSMLNVTIDGASQAGQPFHHAGRIQIEPELIKQVEVLSGTGDATAGPGALGGAVRFVTKDPTDLLRTGDRAGALLKAGYFSNAEGYKAHGTVFGRLTEQWSALASYTRQDQNDYEDGDGERVLSTGSRQQLGFLKLVGQFDHGHSLRLSYDRTEDEGERTQRPQWVTSSFNPAYPLQSERATWNLGYAWQPGNELVDVSLSMFRTESELEQNVIGRWGQYFGQVTSTGFDVRNTSHWRQHRVTYGLDHRRDEIAAGYAADPTAEREDGEVTGVYVQGHFELTRDLSLGVGARHDRYRLNNINDATQRSSGTSPNASVRYALTPQLALLAGHARALRGAKIRDAFKLEGIAEAAPDVDPERARTSEVGFEYQRSAWRWNGKLYDTTVRDAIADPVGQPTQYENVGKLETRGFLLHTAYEGQGWRGAVGFHHNRSTLNGERLNGYEHNGLGTSQGNTLTASLDVRASDRLEAGWTGRFVRRIDALDTSVGTVDKPGYGVHDLYANWRPRVGSDLTLSLVVKNLFDQSYLDHGSNEDFQGIPDYEGIVGSREPGREFRVGLVVRF